MNPFVQHYKLRVIKVNESYTVSLSRGESKATTQYMTSSYLIEEQEKTSFYKFPFDDKFFFKSDLKSTGRDLILYIILNLKKNRDYIDLPQHRITKAMGTSKVTFYNGVNQLTAAGIISRKAVGVYWINPYYIFTGDRIRYFQEMEEEHNEEFINVVFNKGSKPKDQPE